MQVVHRAAAFPHRYPLTASVVVFDHRGRAAGPLEVGADVVGGHAAHCRLDAVAVPSLHSGQAAIVNEAGAGRAAHSRFSALHSDVALAAFMSSFMINTFAKILNGDLDHHI